MALVNDVRPVLPFGTEEPSLRQLLDAPPAFIEMLPIATYACDVFGRLLWFNSLAAELWGRSPRVGDDAQRFCGSHRHYFSGRVISPEETPVAHALRTGTPVRGVKGIIERPDGSRVWTMAHILPVTDMSGAVAGAIHCFHDATELHQAKAELQEKHDEAEARQIALLKELNHRVKNNMQTLQSLLSSAHRETANPEARAVLADATRRVAAMAAAQKVLYEENQSAVFSAEDFLQSVCATARMGLGNQTSIVVEGASGFLPNDVAMPLALILNELLTNAATYAVENASQAVIRVGLCDNGDGMFRLWVHDSGPGFEVSRAARKRASGLGLVDGLTSQLGGNFAVERADGALCTVRFRLRRHHDYERESNTARPS